MLKVGDKCKWAPVAIRHSKNKEKAAIKKQIVEIYSISKKPPYNVTVTTPEAKEAWGWYKQKWLIRL